jgi:hypothetical protein
MSILYFTQNMGTKICMQAQLITGLSSLRLDVLLECAGQSSKEGFYLLGYKAVQSVESQPTCRRNMPPQSSGLKVLLSALCLFLAWIALQPWRWRRHIPPKYRLSFQRTTGHHITEDRILHNHQCENLKSYKSVMTIFPQLNSVIYLQQFPFN